jgi:site-specific DNA-methyltransferase (adenine-specific)
LIIHGDSLHVLKTMPDNSIDSCVTDPPYGLSKEPDITEVLTKWLNGEPYDHKHGGFMGKAWDSFVPHPDIWKEVYRVLKPGAHALVFAGTRTQDLMTIALRLAGFEVRDVIEWLYFSGFPKSMDVGKAFDKREGAEREVVGKTRSGISSRSREGDFIGGKAIEEAKHIKITAPATDLAKQWDGWGTALKPAHEPIIVVRKPLIGTIADNVEQFGTGAVNVDGCRIAAYDGQDRSRPPRTENACGGKGTNTTASEHNENGRFPANIVTVEPDVFFSKYCNVTPEELCKKAGKRDRGEGNNHPTVKPSDLMAWLVRLVTPPKGTVLDPFAGSGSTLVAAKREGFEYIGIEQEAAYVEIAKARTEAAATNEEGQITLF